MKRIDTVIVGGGQAGLALSHCLTRRGLEHVVLERGRLGERWRSERWDSLRLLTPRWQSRLPGWSYRGPDPDGYMTGEEVVAYLEDYAASFGAPVRAGVSVRSVRPRGDRFEVLTDMESWLARNVVVATGDCHEAAVPGIAREIPSHVHQVVPTRYRNPAELPEGGVLVVGASATGLQLAAEIHESGRPVTLSVGRHTRLPRTYRGRDVLYWLDEMGVFDERWDEVADLESSREQPSLQLVGTPERATLDLAIARSRGIRLVGRTLSANDATIRFDDNLVEDVAAADFKLARLLRRIDRHIESTGRASSCPPALPFRPVEVDEAPTFLDLADEGIRTVLWATGFRRRYPWLHVPVLDARGEISHEGGVTPWPGLYVMGLRFLRRRASSFIDGQRHDAEDIADHLVSRSRIPPRPPRHRIDALIV